MHHRIFTGLVVTAMLAASFAAPVAAQSVITRIVVETPSPRAFEPIHVRVENVSCELFRGVRFDGTRLRLEYSTTGCPVVPVTRNDRIAIGRLPAGTWTLVIGNFGTPGTQTVSTTVTVADNDWAEPFVDNGTLNARNVIDVSGVWGVDGRPGHGLTLALAADGQLVGTLYGYHFDRDSRFHTLQTVTPFDGRGWRARMFASQGSPLIAPPGPVATFGENEVGIEFFDSDSAQMCIASLADPPTSDACYTLTRYPLY